MTDIGPEISRSAKTDLRIHVRPVEVNLATVLMDNLADLANGRFENAVRTGIGYHKRTEIVGVLVNLGAQIGQIDVALFRCRNRNHLESRHDRAGWIGAVR